MSFGIRINTNVPAISAQRALGANNLRLQDNYRKLASGSRITRAGDDAAGLAISENMRAQIRGTQQANRNTNDAISLIQTAEGGLNEISNIVIRLRELAVQAASDTVGSAERNFTDIEFQQLKDEIDRISNVLDFNGTKLLNGTGGMLEFQVGLNNNPVEDRILYDGNEANTRLSALGLTAESISTKEGAQVSLERLDQALLRVNGARAKLGATQNRLTSIVNNLGIYEENISAANSRIRDLDIAKESSEMIKNNILVQSGTAVLGQANAAQQSALKLLG